MKAAPETNAVAHCLFVRGYRDGSLWVEEWPVVFDTYGNVIEGSPSDSASAVQIRYLELHHIPHKWVYHKATMCYQELDRLLSICAASNRLRILQTVLPKRRYFKPRFGARLPIIPRRG